ncbi:MAG: ERF family protein, partial [Exiguobacterium sp.]|nr:ERF family protein [Exiguobacterium sp.]
VSCVVIGEGMDTGDKASNKAMSVGMKYAAFQLFMIPTEEMIDPDAECHEVKPKANPKPVKQDAPANVTQAATLPKNEPADPSIEVLDFLAHEREELRKVREITKAENVALWNAQIAELKKAGLCPDKPLKEFTKSEAVDLVACMYSNFDPNSTVLKNVG